MEIDILAEYRGLGEAIDDMDTMGALPDEVLFRRNTGISNWTAAHHLYHVALSDGRMCKAIQAICSGHEMASEEPGLNDIGRKILTAEDMMRGRGKAPGIVVPPEEISRPDLEKTLVRCRSKYVEIEALLPSLPAQTGGIPHPFMGVLGATQWLRLARIHSRHHLAIMRELVDA